MVGVQKSGLQGFGVSGFGMRGFGLNFTQGRAKTKRAIVAILESAREAPRSPPTASCRKGRSVGLQEVSTNKTLRV